MIEHQDRYFRTLKTLDIFVDRALGLVPMGPHLSGFHFNRELLKAAMANTYLETVGPRADSIHLAIKKAPAADVYWEYRKTVGVLDVRSKLSEHDAVLALDYTHEDFYGDVQGMWLHGWTGARGVTGKFKFLTCAVVSKDIPQKIPLISIPVNVGHNMAREVCWCLAVVRPLVRSIRLTLYDREFYSKELMLTLASSEFPYLIFVPRNKKVRSELEAMVEGEARTKPYPFKLNKDMTTLRGTTTMAFLKQVFDARSKKNYDWAFATSEESVDLDHIVATYKGRWRIETGFRVQDEARIKSKSKDPRVRFFLFVYEQVLQLLWVVLYKEEVSFKRFLIDMYEVCAERNRRTG